MWVLTVYAGKEMKMFEFETEMQAREAFAKTNGCKVLSEVVYYNDPHLTLVAI